MFGNSFGKRKNVCCGLVHLIKRVESLSVDEPMDCGSSSSSDVSVVSSSDSDDDVGWGQIKAPIPLISVDIKASVVHTVAQVEVTQVYVNKEDLPIEAIYYFPVDPEGAVTHFQAELEGRVIQGTVKPREEAKKVYDKAVKNKTSAFLGEETDADIFKVRVGFLKLGVQVKVIIGYVTEVKNEPGSDAVRFYIPTTIAPRYVPPSARSSKAKEIKKMKFSPSSPAPLSLKVAVSLQGGIKSIECPTHTVEVGKTEPISGKTGWQKTLVELTGETTDMDRDFVLNIIPEDVHKPRIYSEKREDGSNALMVHLVPSFKLDEQKAELIFVLDRSGSMAGQSINLAKKALLLFLHSMPADCYFNVIGFGSTHKFLFPTSVQYNDRNLQKAISHAKTLRADLGGTEILQPLMKIYEKPCIPGYLRQIFVLTDGEVENTDEVFGIVQANAHQARVFALGIGNGTSHHLIEGVAKAGGGTSDFVTYTESIDKKVLNQLKNGLQPSLTEVELEWEGVDNAPIVAAVTPPIVLNKKKTLRGYNKPMETESSANTPRAQNTANLQSPKRIPPVYDGSQMLVFGLFSSQIPTAVNIKAQSPDGQLTLRIEHLADNDIGPSDMLHRLAAVKLVREMELEVAALHFEDFADVSAREEKLKKDIIEIACKSGITSKYTSFVAVDGTDGLIFPGNWLMGTRYVHSQVVHGWERGCGGGGGAPRSRVSRKSSGHGNWERGNGGGGGAPRSRVAKKSSGGNPPRRQLATKAARRSAPYSAGTMQGDPPADMSQNSTLMQMISLQSFDGSYDLDNKLANIVGKSLEVLKAGAARQNLDEKVFATFLTICLFVNKMSAEKELWDLVVKKSRKWLSKLIQSNKMDEIMEAVATFL